MLYGKNWRTGFLASAVFVSMVGQSALAFTDVSNSFWADQFIEYLNTRNVITGYPDNTFRPSKPVTRAEFAVMLAKSQDLNTNINGSAFGDVPASHWAAGAIQSVAQKGWIAGYPGNRFLPNQPISMAEMYTILSKVNTTPGVTAANAGDILKEFSDAGQVPEWAKVPVASAAQSGIYVAELAQNRLLPTTDATRASVAAAMAKLMNPSFRDPIQVAGGQQQQNQNLGEAINVTGTLQATARAGEWMVVTENNERYYITPSQQQANKDLFKVGNRVELSGNIDKATSTSQRRVVAIDNIASVQPMENRVTISGTLVPSQQTSGAWLVKTTDNRTFRITNPGAFNSDIFKYGAQVNITGNARPDINLPTSEGTALVASNISATQQQQEVSFVGTLKPTVTAGGWTVTNPSTGNTYVLMDVDQQTKAQTWFQNGSQVMVRGEVRDIPNIYQQGPVMVVSEIEPTANSLTGPQQISFYYPHKNPVVGALFGNPLTRRVEGPNVPFKVVETYLKGPTSLEQNLGYTFDSDWANLDVEAVNVSTEGRATVVLEAPANAQITAAEAQQLNAALMQTLSQVSGVQDVDVTIQDPQNKVIWQSQ